jgi:hypothetical protein
MPLVANFVYHGARALQHRKQAAAAAGNEARAAHTAMADHHSELAGTIASQDVSDAVDDLLAGA